MDSGTRVGGTISSAAATSSAVLEGHGERLLDVDDADDVVRAVVDDGHAGVPAGRADVATTSAALSVAFTDGHPDARGHHVGGVEAENRSVRSSSVASSASSSPAVAERRTRELSSSAVRAPDELLLRLDAQGADELVGGVVEQQHHGLNTVVKAAWNGTTTLAVASGSARAKFFGTSSPITIENSVASTDRPPRRPR